MLSEPALDLLALAFLVVTALAWAKVFYSYRKTPTDWLGPQEVFAACVQRERFWTAFGWGSLLLGSVVTFIDLIVN